MDDQPKEVRRVLLEQALAATCGERNVSYGSPNKNLADCAALWTAYLAGKYHGLQPGYLPEHTYGRFELTSEDVAWLNVLQKIARTFHGIGAADTYIDAAAYAAIAGECTEGSFS